MKPMPVAAVVVALGLGLPCLAHEAPSHEHAELVPIPEYNPPFGEASAAASLQAAEVFLASLDGATRSGLILDLDAKERAGWSNLPASSVDRAGISVGELSDEQRKLLFDFLASSLSEAGYRRVMEVMAAEAFLNKARWSSTWRKIAPEYYWISFFGIPSATTAWGWQFGGHHLGLNVSVEGNRVTTMSPSFVGIEPTIFTYDGVAYEALVDMHRAGYALYSALDAAQKAAADAGRVPQGGSHRPRQGRRHPSCHRPERRRNDCGPEGPAPDCHQSLGFDSAFRERCSPNGGARSRPGSDILRLDRDQRGQRARLYAYTRPYVDHRARIERGQSGALSHHLSKSDIGVWRLEIVIRSSMRLMRILPSTVQDSGLGTRTSQ